MPAGPWCSVHVPVATASADNRIEPIPCGQREWEMDQGRPILEIARREGVIIALNGK